MTEELADDMILDETLNFLAKSVIKYYRHLVDMGADPNEASFFASNFQSNLGSELFARMRSGRVQTSGKGN